MDDESESLPSASPLIRRLNTQQIGHLGELRLSMRFYDAESDRAPLTSDAGRQPSRVPGYTRALTHNSGVKTEFSAETMGEVGSPAIDWRIDEDCPAKYTR